MTPAKRPRGRPKAPLATNISIRLTLPQKAVYLELGGARWVKRLIDEFIKGKK